MLFVKHPDLLKSLVSDLLGIEEAGIDEFVITNPEMPPDGLGEKFCRLDISMIVNAQRVDIEIQVADEGDYPERSLYYWAREYSSALEEGEAYHMLPRVIVISILAFKLFECEAYHSEFCALEVTRCVQLTDKMSLHYFELPKLPEAVSSDDELGLWLALFKAETEEELKQIEGLEVAIMDQAISAYRSITATDEFREKERLRSRARHNEAAALLHAAEVERKKWQAVLTDKDAAIADKDAAIADKDALIAELMARLEAK